jgi:glycine betaine/choline ABC-type transport system substrate-binding protein
MGGTKIIAGVTAALAFLVSLLAMLLAACSGSQTGGVLRVGSKNFTEQVVLGEIIAQHLERRLHQKVERRLNLGGTMLANQALVEGEIDLYPE